MKGIDKLRTGDFNDMSQEEQLDGSVKITLSKRGEGKVYILVVKDLYGSDEVVVSEEVQEVYL